MKGLIFIILCKSVLICLWFIQLLLHTGNSCRHQFMGVLWLFYFLIEELSFLNALNCALKCMLALYFLCGIKKALRAMDLFFVSNFQSLACKGKFMSFYTYWSIKGLIFVILWETPLICSWFIQMIWHTENSCHHFFSISCCCLF